MTAPTRDLIVIGASAGGVAALQVIAAGLPAKVPAAVLVVLHIGVNPSRMHGILERAGPNSASVSVNGEPLRHGHIFVAPPDHHLLVQDDRIVLTRGPKENQSRPAIDPLFRSAAIARGTRVIGVVLSGCNDDGTAGLAAIKRCGGLAVVQDPAEAHEPAMPRSALRGVQVDHCLPLAGIGELLAREAGRIAPVQQPLHDDLIREHAVSLSAEDASGLLQRIGKPSTNVCPECGGTLFQLGDEPMRFRCHTGHAYSLDSLNLAQKAATEEALWAAIRALQEREGLVRQMAELDRMAGDERMAQGFDQNAERLRDHVTRLRELVEKQE